MLKVASYCRVSTDKEDQANSFESQQRCFREYIDRQPDWELYQVYADEGASIIGPGTQKNKKKGPAERPIPSLLRYLSNAGFI